MRDINISIKITNMNDFNYLFRYIIIGDTNVGKSCFLLQFTEKTFKKEHEATIGMEFGSTIIDINKLRVKLQIWDTAGQESFKSLTRSYYRGAIGALLVYDITRRSSFENVSKWLDETRTYASDKIIIVLVGNKLDQEDKRVISYEEGQEFALRNDLSFFETSAKSGINVDEVFIKATETILEKLNQGELSPANHQGIKIIKSPLHEIDPNKNKSSTCC